MRNAVSFEDIYLLSHLLASFDPEQPMPGPRPCVTHTAFKMTQMDSIAETLSVDIASPTTELRRNRNRARERAMREQTSEEARQTRKLTKRTGVKGLLCHWRHSKTPSLNCINVLNDLYTDWGGNDVSGVQ